MRPLVLDASIVCAWFLEDEVGVAGVRERLRRESGIVPPIFHLEVRNALLVAHRRGRIDSQDLRDHIGSVAALPLLTDDGLDLDVALELAMQHHLSLYDAVYLELAKRRAATLATLDRALLRAAAEEQIVVVEVPSALA